MELANLEVAVIYKKNYLNNGFHIMKYLASKEAAAVYINEKEIDSNYKIVMMPLFEVLNRLLEENYELRDKIEIVEEKLNR